MGFEDPIRKEVPKAIAECHQAGVRVMMITGDHPNTASNVAAQMGLPHPEHVLTGVELDRFSDAELHVALKTSHVCARISPTQKQRLISCLKDAGEVVAMTGDGVNDVPALKSASIAIAMGGRGCDAAREAASLVLVHDDFSSLVIALKMGRSLFDNLQNAMGYLLAVHIPIAGMALLPVFFNLPLVLMPIHIAFLHLIIEPASSVAFEAQPAFSGSMHRPPRKAKEALFSPSILRQVLWRGFGILAALVVLFVLALNGGRGEDYARTLTFTTLMLANVGLIVSTGSLASRFRIGNVRNPALGWIVFGALLLLVLILGVPPLNQLFRICHLTLLEFFLCLGVGLLTSLGLGIIAQLRTQAVAIKGKALH